MICGIASIPTLRPWLTLEFPSFQHAFVLIENNLSDKYIKMHIHLLHKFDWLKNFLNFPNSGRQNKTQINMTSNSHSTMDDLESEDNTTANPYEQDSANCEGENANLNRQEGASKKATDNWWKRLSTCTCTLYIASAIVPIGWIHWTLVGVVWFFVLELGIINFVCF